ncbi:UTP--glucose-1-phosphate uridylyltransferase-like isoform X2 [Bolinopsis microptera]|uniref:UTP--glucose-1-phosphate uridylyltransferase-like isoform X2 n=1 Tax=Bolinopsis microptera TaxID=2820187 RepID=UPI00307A61B9
MTPVPAKERDRTISMAAEEEIMSILKERLKEITNKTPLEKQENVSRELDNFYRLYGKWRGGISDELIWDKIRPLPESMLQGYSSLKKVDEDDTEGISKLLDKLVVLKLNGGLGTGMGLGSACPKSLIRVREESTFLDITISQIENLNESYGVSVPLVLMNSLNTDSETGHALKKYKGSNVEVLTYLQSYYPRIDRETLLPFVKDYNDDGNDGWYPPGHGDLYESLYNSGVLDKLIEMGKEIIFISNIDNLGATVDLNILSHIVKSGCQSQFIAEVTNKTRADVKGGTLIDYNGCVKLLEYAQVPKEHVDDFKCVKKFKIFNTNNLWINLKSIRERVVQGTLERDVIVNHKALGDGRNVIQLETAVGAAIKNFSGAFAINVPRSRFLPVKHTSDLLLVMSNLYSLEEGVIAMSPDRMFPSTPLIKLGPDFKRIQDFLKRFQTIPDLLELDHLTVTGDVHFGRDVSLRGTVIIIANHGERIDIPSNSLLENKIVSGNLRILDH